jgi:hypothetical protein
MHFCVESTQNRQPCGGDLECKTPCFIFGILPNRNRIVRRYVTYECVDAISKGLDYVLRHFGGKKHDFPFAIIFRKTLPPSYPSATPCVPVHTFPKSHFLKMVMSQKEVKMEGQCGLNAVLLYVFSFFPAFGFPKAIHYICIGIYIYTYIYML